MKNWNSKVLSLFLLTMAISAAPAFAHFDGPPGDGNGGGGSEFQDPPPSEDNGPGDDYCGTGIDGESVAYALGDKCDCDSTLNKYKSCLNSKGKAVRAGLRRIGKLLDDEDLVADYDAAREDLIDECEALLEEEQDDPSDDDPM